MRQAFKTADYRWLPAMLLSILLFYWIKAWRWSLLLRPVKSCGTWQVTPAMMIGFAFNNILPAHLGDLVRVFIFARNEKAPTTGVLATVALERVLDVLAILILLALGLAMVQMPDDTVRRRAWFVAGIAAVGVVCALIYLFWTRPFVNFVEAVLARLKFLPSGFSKKVADLMEAGAAGLASLKDPRLIMGLVASSLAQWLLNALLVYFAIISFGLNVPFLVSFVVMGVVAFAVTIPSTPGYFGVIQVAFGMSAGLFVAEQFLPTVYAASVYYHLVQWIPITLVGLILFQRSGLSLAAVDQEATHLAEEPVPGGVPQSGEVPT
jgi:uncharacterized protein (TIRG00374 family)